MILLMWRSGAFPGPVGRKCTVSGAAGRRDCDVIECSRWAGLFVSRARERGVISAVSSVGIGVKSQYLEVAVTPEFSGPHVH